MTTAQDLIGKPVIATMYEGTYAYGGEHEHDGWTTLSFDMRYGRMTTLTSDFADVAPADVEIPVKDDRVRIEKLPKKRDYQDAGVWLFHLDVPGFDGNKKTARKTKKEAMEKALRTLAILDWHAANDTSEVLS